MLEPPRSAICPSERRPLGVNMTCFFGEESSADGVILRFTAEEGVRAGTGVKVISSIFGESIFFGRHRLIWTNVQQERAS